MADIKMDGQPDRRLLPRVGWGYDAHRFAAGRPLVLGGVEIPHQRGLEGHSDADVLLHAICDAILGALGRGDIGEHFPDTDETYRGISSLKLLKTVNDLALADGYQVGNIDAVVLAEEPKISEHKRKMKFLIAFELAIDETAVNIKATTNEGMGFVGRREGIAAYACVLLYKTSLT